MLRCRNCDGPVDKNAVACPKCGRPSAGHEASSARTGGLLAALIAIAGFIGYSWIAGVGQEPATAPTAGVDSPSEQTAIPAADGSPATSGDEPMPALPLVEPEDAQEAIADRFVFSAQLRDRRGRIVLQSGPGIAARNVAIVPAGTLVHAETTIGKWVRVKTSDGQVGYVRLKQLQFSSSATELDE